MVGVIVQNVIVTLNFQEYFGGKKEKPNVHLLTMQWDMH